MAGRNISLTAVVLLVILPFEAIAVPLFYMLSDYRNTYPVQFLPFIANAFSIYLFYTFFVGLPKQIEEAARVDGAGPWRTFFLIAAADVEAGVRHRHDPAVPRRVGCFLLAGDGRRPAALPTAAAGHLGVPGAAADRLGTDLRLRRDDVLPVLIVFLVFQRWFIQSVATSGLKG